MLTLTLAHYHPMTPLNIAQYISDARETDQNLTVRTAPGIGTVTMLTEQLAKADLSAIHVRGAVLGPMDLIPLLNDIHNSTVDVVLFDEFDSLSTSMKVEVLTHLPKDKLCIFHHYLVV